ncbi:hypothetical protein JCM21900_006280 [Sporobolomyces salmonicolor]
MPPPPLHPSLPARPSTSYPPSSLAARPPSLAPPPASSPTSHSTPHNPLSLPNRPAFHSTPQPASPRPSAPSSLSGAPAASPKAATHAKDDAAEAPWPRVKERVRPDEVKVNAELVELGEGWAVTWRCWKAPAVPLSNAVDAGARDLTNYDPFAPFARRDVAASTAKPGSTAEKAKSSSAASKDNDNHQPPKKKSRPLNAFDELLADELATASPAVPTPLPESSAAPPTPVAGPSTSRHAATTRLRSQLDALRAAPSCAASEDLLERARKAVVRRAKDRAAREGGDKLGLFCYVKVANASLTKGEAASEDLKGKGKAREVSSEEEGEEVAGRTLWAFGLTRGGESEGAEGWLDGLTFEGLECISSGTFTHRSLFPSLYPSEPSSNSTPPFRSLLSLPAKSYPSALSLSSHLFAVPSATGPPPRQTEVAAAHEAFVAAINELLVTELLYAPQTAENAKRLRVGESLVYLPPNSAFPARFDSFSSISANSHISPTPRRRSPPLATLATLRTIVQRSTLFVQTFLEEVPYRPFPTLSPPHSLAVSPPMGTPALLAPLNLRARFVRRVEVDPGRDGQRLKQLEDDWRSLLEGSGLDISSENSEWVICRLDLSSATSSSDAFLSASTEDDLDIELTWPASLIIIDGTRPLPPPSPLTSPEKPKPPDLPASALISPEMTRNFPFPTASDFSAAPRPPINGLTSLLRYPYDAAARRRLASQALNRSRRRQRTSTGAEEEEDELEHRRDPLARRTREVWSWMEDEVARRVKEQEERTREEEEERRRAVEAERERERDKEREREKEKSAHHPPVAAPINMRTPMSLGTASTEAPSPADVAFPLPGISSGISTVGAVNVGGSGVAAGGAGAPMAIDGIGLGMYPSPAEQPSTVPSMGPTTSQPGPMSSLDAAFAEFDWGDGSFGTSGGGAPGGVGGGDGQDYDDGMNLLGLTDDDFSFFDAPPTPLPATSMPPPVGFASAGTSPKFADHFAHLHGTPFTSAVSPTSPFAAQSSPHFPPHASPGTGFNFSFDPTTTNALGLASSTSATLPLLALASTTPASVCTSAASPHKTPCSPFAIELASASYNSPAHAASPVALRSVSLAGTPVALTALTPYSPFTASRTSSAFEPIAFGPSHFLADEKYDPRKGKFGLPSPESEGEDTALFPLGLRRSSSKSALQPSSLEPWYTSVCDPRFVVAERLKRNRRSSMSKAAADRRGSSGSRGKSAGWVKARGWTRQSQVEEGSDFAATGDEESSESEMELEEDDDDLDASERDARAGEDNRAVLGSFGAELLLLKGVIGGLVDRAAASSGESKLPAKASSATDVAREITLHVVADQVMYNPEFRTSTLELCRGADERPKLVSARAIELVSAALSSVCSALSPSPLFADHTVLPLLDSHDAPTVLLRSQQSIMQMSTSAIDFWRPMGFEPLLGRKDVTAFALYEDVGQAMHEVVKEWLRLFGTVYQGIRLGEHTPGTIQPTGNFPGAQDGLIPVTAGLLTEARGREEFKTLCATLAEVSRSNQNVVVYIFTPLDVSPLSASSPLAAVIQQISRSKTAITTMLPCPIPLSHLFHDPSTASRLPGVDRLAALAFSVYDQIQTPVNKLRFPVPETFPSASYPTAQSFGAVIRLFQSPAVSVAPARPPKVTFELSWPPSSLAVEHRHRFLHICYSSKPANAEGTLEWLLFCSIDDKGETWRLLPRLIKIPNGMVADVHRVRAVWNFAKICYEQADVEWRIIVCKLGEPTAIEMRAWDSVLKEQLAMSKRPLHVTVVCADLDPPLAAQPCSTPARRSSHISLQSDTISEEGELTLIATSGNDGSSSSKPSLFDTQPSVFAFTPAEPATLATLPILAPATTYLIHIPRIPSFTHSSIQPFPSPPSPSPAPISVHALHFLLSHSSRSSSFSGSLGDLVTDVRQSYVELAALGQARWGTSGRLGWHLEAVRTVHTLVDCLA